MFNSVTAYILVAEAVDFEIQSQISYFSELGQEFEWKVFSFDEPPDLKERLAAAGFEVGPKEAVAIYDLQLASYDFASMKEWDVVVVKSDQQLEDYRELAELIFGRDHGSTVSALKKGIEESDTYHQAFLLYIDGKAVSMGRLYTHPQSCFAGFYGGGTHPDYCGKGYYRSIIAARAMVAQERGVRYLQVDALPTSLPILNRLGFEHLVDTWPCTLNTVSHDSVRKISA